MINILKNALILFAITICSGLLLGITYSVTKEPIEVQQKIILDKALNTVIQDAKFVADTNINLDDYNKITNIFQATKDGETVGYAFEITTKEGYTGIIEMIVGINISGEISGIDITKHSETPGLGANADQNVFKDLFKGRLMNKLVVVKGGSKEDNEIDSLTGATITSVAITNAVNQAIECFENNKLGEGAR